MEFLECYRDHIQIYHEHVLKRDISLNMKFTWKKFMHIQQEHTNQ